VGEDAVRDFDDAVTVVIVDGVVDRGVSDGGAQEVLRPAATLFR
jgi:hypothetical protein